ncbi:hypothetical protein ACQPUY_15435 [Clostridium nigeriense]|uniref:hypothetical protein n=1 Tax=Clostridium nigeriense TaxID=1805470 RepID=UPI003D3303D3
MKIEKITMVGFKGYKDKVEYNFSGNKTTIVGPNGSGKTTIAEGICWCLYGCNLIGNDKVDTLLLNNNSTEMEVEVEISIEDILYKINRSKKKTISIKLNDKKITQKALDEIIPQKELFLSIFNPKYFLNLTPAKARARLISMLPKIDPLKILERYNAWDNMPIISKYQGDINNGIKELSKKIKEDNDNLNIKIGEGNTYIQLKKDIERNNKDIDIQVFISDDELELIEKLEDKIRVERSKKYVGVSSKELELKLQILNNKYREVSLEQFKSDNSDSISEMELELATMRGQYKILLQNLNEAKELGCKCNSCRQSIPEEFKLTQINSIENQIQNIKLISNEYSKSIGIIKSMDLDRKAEFDKDKQERLRAISEEINSIKADINNLEEINRKAERKFLEAQERALEESIIQLDGLISKRQAALSIKSELDINNSNLKKYKDMLEKVEKDIESIKISINDLTKEKAVLVDYNSYYVNFIGGIFEPILIDTKIHLHKINKDTGEIKEDFFITYKDKEYSLLSNSERIKVGLELANMFNILLNKQYPTVVDDSESILNLPIINTQMIVFRVEDINTINII